MPSPTPLARPAARWLGVLSLLLVGVGWIEPAPLFAHGESAHGESAHGESAHGESAHGQAAIRTTWTPKIAARGKAKTAKMGVVFYNPAQLGNEHSIFASPQMAEQSLKSPFVKMLVKERQEFLERFGAKEKMEAIAVTDWHGNLIALHEVKSVRDKLPLEKILAQIRGAEKFIQNLEKRCNRDLAKGEKALAKKRWAKAIKSFSSVASVRGLEEGEKARERMAEIESVGRDQIESAKALAEEDPKAAAKALKAIAKEFQGSSVEIEAQKAAARIEECFEFER